MRNGAQAAHDAADAERIGDCMAQVVFLRHFKIGNSAWLITTNLESNNNKVRSFQCFALIGMSLNPGLGTKRLCKFTGNNFGFSQAYRVDVHQGYRRTRQRGAIQKVANNVLHEHG